MGSSRTDPAAADRSVHDRLRGVAIFRLGRDWVSLPTADVVSLHWRGMLNDHRDPRTGLAWLRSDQGLLPLLDALPLAGAARRLVPEFVLVIRNALAAGQPQLAGLMVEEFGEVVRLDAEPAGRLERVPDGSPWWAPFLHPQQGYLLSTRQGAVPILSAARLIPAVAQWSAAGDSC